MTWSASPCSFTTMAPHLAKKGACCAGRDIHDARRVAEEMRLSRITCSTMKTCSRMR